MQRQGKRPTDTRPIVIGENDNGTSLFDAGKGRDHLPTSGAGRPANGPKSELKGGGGIRGPFADEKGLLWIDIREEKTVFGA